MASIAEHYDQVLADVYSWMLGGFDAAIARNSEFFARRAIVPEASGKAVDLGAGCGFQSIPLARLGFEVTAIDLDRKLLEELRAHAGELPIRTVQDDIVHFSRHVPGDVELAVCMVDTLLHLESKEHVRALFAGVHAALAPGGRLVLTFRDLSREAQELDRFIPVRSDDGTIFTCFLEYEPDTVKVHDLVYRRGAAAWTLHKSFYRKLRLAPQWVTDELHAAGFRDVAAETVNGLVTVVAAKSTGGA